MAQTNDKYRWLAQTGHLGKAKSQRLDLLKKIIPNKKTYEMFTLFWEEKSSQDEFLFNRPFVKADLKALRANRIEYLVFDSTSTTENSKKLKNELQSVMKPMARFTPYWDQEKSESLDAYAQTAAPHVFAESSSRRRLGPVIEVFQLVTDESNL